MSESKKIKYLSKTVSFGGKTLTLFSIDGNTWSSRKQELAEIKERQERDKVSFAAIKEENGETRVVPKGKENVPVLKTRSGDDDVEEVDEDLGVIGDEDIIENDYSLDEEKAAKVKKRGRPAMKALPVKGKAQPAKPVIVAKAKKQEKPKLKKLEKVAPKVRNTSKPKVKPTKGKAKSKKKAA